MKTLPLLSIAICDVQTLFRESIALLLHSYGNIQIVADASNGMELIKQIQQSATLPDVCIIDINIPELNGYDTMKHIYANWPSIKVLILTEFDSEMSILKFLIGGAYGYVLKGCNSQDLLYAIELISNGDYYYPENIVRKLKYIQNNDTLKSQLVISTNEYIFLSYCCTELAYKEIAIRMNLSIRTVENYRDNLFKKLNVRTRVGLVKYALKSGIGNLT